MTTAVQARTYSLTPLQEGMLFHGRLAAGVGVYIQQLVVTLAEPVDADALRLAWQCVTRRHDVLRTAFPDGDGTQLVADDVEVPFDEVEGVDLPAFLTADRRRGFDLATPPLFRLTLIRRGPADFVL